MTIVKAKGCGTVLNDTRLWVSSARASLIVIAIAMTSTANHLSSLRKLGRRLSARRDEARLSAAMLAERARVPVDALERFERGEEPLGIAALGRLGKVLGVDAAEFIHTSVQETKASVAPHVLLKQRGNGDLEQQDLDALERGLLRARSFTELGLLLKVERLAEGLQATAAPEREAHEDGYRWARHVRGLLPERSGPIQRLGRLIENRFNILVLSHTFRNKDVLGASCRTGDARLIVVNAAIPGETQRRFVLAHELAHQVLDLGRGDLQTDVGAFESRQFWFETTPTEKRANAFAAMFLAPDLAVHEIFGPPRPFAGNVAAARKFVIDARRFFGVSYSAMAWHLKNLRYVDDATVSSLLLMADTAELSGFEEETRFDGLERRVLEAFHHELISSGRARELLGRPIEELEGP